MAGIAFCGDFSRTITSLLTATSTHFIQRRLLQSRHTTADFGAAPISANRDASHVTGSGLCVGACAARDDGHLFPGGRPLGRRLIDAGLTEVGASYEKGRRLAATYRVPTGAH